MKYTHVALSLLEMVIILHSPLSTLSSPLSPLPPLPSLLRPPSLLLSPTGIANGHMKEGKFQKWKRRFSESLLRLGSSSGSLENRSPSRSPSTLASNSTNRPRSLVRGVGFWHAVCIVTVVEIIRYVNCGTSPCVMAMW